MKKQLLKFFILNLFVAFLGTALTIQAQNRPYRVSDNQVKITLTSIEARTDVFRRELDSALNNNRQINSDRKDDMMRFVTEFENSTDSLKQRFDAGRSVTNDVTDVLTRAASIDQFIKNNRLNVRTRTYWNNVAADLDKLQGYYRMSGNWRTTPVSNTGQMPYRVSDNEVQLLLSNIETDTDLYRRSLDQALNRNRNNRTINRDQVLDYVTEFENSTDQLKERFDNKRSVSRDVQEVLSRAAVIDGFMKDNRLNQATERNWTSLKSKLDTLSNYYNVAWNWTNPTGNPGNNTGGTYNVSDQIVRTTIANIEARTNIFKRQLTTSLNTGVLKNTRSQTDVIGYVSEFETATNRLKQNFAARRSTSNDVEEVLNRAYYIEGFMRDYRFQQTTEREWRLIRTDLEKLSNYYSVNFDFDNRQPTNTFDANLTGTYRLNLSQSDNVASVVGNSTRTYPANQRERIGRNLENRLKSPDLLAIEKRNNQVTIASSNSPQISFEADGVARTESMPNGRSVKITANSTYDGVSLNYEGDRINDFYVNFVPVNNQLRVIRRVYLENKNETITVASVYDKVNQSAQWSMVGSGNTTGDNSYEDFVVPNNTPLTATLNTPISTRASQNGDRFTLTVNSPSQYNGATIEGRVASAERSGRVSGRANLSLEFDTIRLQNGSTYRFAGIVDKVRMPNGNEIAVNNEGTVRDGSQTTKTVTRAGIGAAIGAIIGAIAGGGQGAAIGAAVGAGAGAGTVVLQGRDDIDLEQGTEFTLTATAPNTTANNR